MRGFLMKNKFKIVSLILSIMIFFSLNNALADSVIQTSDGNVAYSSTEKPIINTNAKSAVLIIPYNS